jgi:hypothetical protein
LLFSLCSITLFRLENQAARRGGFNTVTGLTPSKEHLSMPKAKRVHSTQRRTASKIKEQPAVDREGPSLDLSHRRLEDRVNDLDRLCEITLNLVRESRESPTNLQRSAHAATMAEITQDRMREFKTIYYDWYHAPLKDGDDYVIIPTVSRR